MPTFRNASLILILALSMPSLFLACRSTQVEDPVLATFKGGDIKQSTYDQWFTLFGKKEGDDPLIALQEMVLQKHFAQVADAKGLVTEDEINLFTTFKLGALAAGILRREVAATVVVSEEDIQKTMAISRDKMHRPRKVRLRNIFKRYPVNATPAEKAALHQRLLDIRKRIQLGEDFAAIAIAESDSQTRFNKGILGNVAPGKLHPKVDAIAMAMKPGTFSDPIETQDGLTLLFCERIIPGQTRTEAEFRQNIENALQRRQEKRAWDQKRVSLLDPKALAMDWAALKNESNPETAIFASYEDLFLTVSGYRALLKQANIQIHDELPEKPGLVESLFLQFKYLEALGERPEQKEAFESREGFFAAQYKAARGIAATVAKDLVPPTEEEMRRLYQREKQRFQNPQQYRCQVLQFPYQGEELVKATEEMLAIENRITNGEITFEEAIQAYSQHPSKANLGHLDWRNEQQLSRLGFNLVRAARELKPGEMSGLIQEDSGLWLIRLNEYREKRPQTFAEAKSQIETFMGQMLVVAQQENLIAELIPTLDIQTTAAFQRAIQP